MNLPSAKTKPSLMRETWADFLSLFFPHCCLGCARALVKGEDILCTICIHELPRTFYHETAHSPILQKFAGRIPVKYAWAYLKFRKTGIVQHLMHQLKYNNKPEVGIQLGRIFGHELTASGFQNEFDAIIPVPLHISRLRKRGYNQSTKFAEGLSQTMRVPVYDNISVKLLKTETQTKKTRSERWENVKHSFNIVSSNAIIGKRILLVDDVITTGATLEACGHVLLNSGCRDLSIACIAEAQ